MPIEALLKNLFRVFFLLFSVRPSVFSPLLSSTGLLFFFFTPLPFYYHYYQTFLFSRDFVNNYTVLSSDFNYFSRRGGEKEFI